MAQPPDPTAVAMVDLTWWLMAFTGALAVFTGLLVLATFLAPRIAAQVADRLVARRADRDQAVSFLERCVRNQHHVFTARGLRDYAFARQPSDDKVVAVQERAAQMKAQGEYESAIATVEGDVQVSSMMLLKDAANTFKVQTERWLQGMRSDGPLPQNTLAGVYGDIVRMHYGAKHLA